MHFWTFVWNLIVTNFGTILLMVGGLLGGATWFNSKRKGEIALAVYYAFHALQDWDSLEPSGWADQATKALAMIDQYLVGNGWRGLKPGEQQAVQVALQGMTGAVAKVAALGAASVAPAPAQSPSAPSPK